MTVSNSDPGDLYISLTYDDAPAAIEFICTAFGFEKMLVVPGEDGKVMHSELKFGRAVVMVSSPKTYGNRVSPKTAGGSHACVCMRVDDPDSHFARAKSANAEIVQEVVDEDYGSRGYMAKDPEGVLWYFGTYQPGQHWE